MSETYRCPKCGSEVAVGGAGGLCPKCLLMGAEAGAETEMTAGAMAGGAASAWVPPTVEELAGAIPGCEVERLIGRGGMGAVYRAKQGELERVVAVKVLPKELGNDAGFAERFRREAQVMARLDHPNIVKVFDFGQAASGHFYFVMEHVEGMDLQRLIRSGGLGEKEALSIVGQVCDALQYAHCEGFVHRDIKPANLMLTGEGKVKVGDFGIARVLGDMAERGSMLTAVGQGLGTAAYAAPEQLSGGGAIDHRADIYSLGVVLYEMLTGEIPRGAFDLPSERVKVDVRLDEVVVRAMKSSPERRYQAVGEVKADVETIASGAVPPRAAAHGRGRGSRWGILGCLILACLGVMLLLAVMIVPWLSYRAVGLKEMAAKERALAAATMAEIRRAEPVEQMERLKTITLALSRARGADANPRLEGAVEEEARGLVDAALQADGANPDVLAVAAEVYRALGDEDMQQEMARQFMDHADRDHPRWNEIGGMLESVREVVEDPLKVERGR